MKKQLTFALLFISIFSSNLLPAQSAETTKTVKTINTSETNTVKSTKKSSDTSLTTAGEWCVYIPGFGNVCLPL